MQLGICPPDEEGYCEGSQPEKAAIVAEVRDRLAASDAVLLTEYRGLKVADMVELRSSLRAAGGEYKIYKNRLARLAADDLGMDLHGLLAGPTAMAFVSSDGDTAAVAKALRDFCSDNDSLVLKGGVLNDTVIGFDDIVALAELPRAKCCSLRWPARWHPRWWRWRIPCRRYRAISHALSVR